MDGPQTETAAPRVRVWLSKSVCVNSTHSLCVCVCVCAVLTECVCSPPESTEFILYAVRNSIHRYDLLTGTDQPLPLTGLREAVALDFDYDRNCLYWADISLDTIQVSTLTPIDASVYNPISLVPTLTPIDILVIYKCI